MGGGGIEDLSQILYLQHRIKRGFSKNRKGGEHMKKVKLRKKAHKNLNTIQKYGKCACSCWCWFFWTKNGTCSETFCNSAE